MTEAEKLIKAGRELLDVVEKYYGESREMPIICKHEPMIYESHYERLIAATGIKDYPDRGPSYKMYCEHCGSKIKATGWEVV